MTWKILRRLARWEHKYVPAHHHNEENWAEGRFFSVSITSWRMRKAAADEKHDDSTLEGEMSFFLRWFFLSLPRASLSRFPVFLSCSCFQRWGENSVQASSKKKNYVSRSMFFTCLGNLNISDEEINISSIFISYPLFAPLVGRLSSFTKVQSDRHCR
jgi:hypothetical protein